MPDVSARCWFDCGALETLFNEARRWPLRETGGALLGWRDGDDTVVARVLGPGPDAKHGWSSFEPDAAWQNRQGASIYADSERTIAYLGDWHTHPRGATAPSSQDRRTAEMLATDAAFRTPIPLYAIAGRPKWPRPHASWRLAVFEWHSHELATTPMEVCDIGA